jgi:hypothetical protein
MLNTTPPTFHSASDGAHARVGRVASRPCLYGCSYRFHPDARVCGCEFPAVDTAPALTLLVDRSLLVVCDFSIESHARRPNPIGCDPRYASNFSAFVLVRSFGQDRVVDHARAKGAVEALPEAPGQTGQRRKTARHPPGSRCAAASSSRSRCSSASSFSIRCARLSAARSACWRSTSGETTAACCRSRSDLAAASLRIRVMVSICFGLSGGTPQQRGQCTGPSR